MAKIIRFPKIIHADISSKKIPKIDTTTANRSTNNGINDIVYCLEELNDTLKYVTDGLYAISVEVNETNKRIDDIKKVLLLFCFLLFL
jgi:endonuclease IV